MEIWSKCDICGRDIPVGELCYGLKKGNCICKDCCTGFENCTFTLAPSPTLTPPNEPRAGLYGKYTVYKNKDGSLVTDCFILRPAKDPAAVAALRAYAATTDNAELAADIINWVGAEPNEPLTMEQLREMDGQPVWVTSARERGNIPSRWVLFAGVSKSKRNSDVFVFATTGGIAQGYEAVNYGKTWNAYRRPPEGEA